MKSACGVLGFIALVIPCFGLSQTSDQNHKPLTNQAVVSMAKSGIDDETIIGLIKTHLTQFDTSLQGLKDLKQNGLHPQIIEAMVAAVRSSSSSSPENKSQDAGRATPSTLGDALNSPPSTSTSNGASSRSTRPPRTASQNPSSDSPPSGTTRTSPTAPNFSPLSEALDVAPHSSPQDVLAGTSVLAVTLDVIDQAGVGAERTFRAETAAPVRHGVSELLPAGALVYLKVVRTGANNDWTTLNISVDSIIYKGSQVKVSSNVQHVRIRTSAESVIRNRTVRWPIQQVQIMPKTRFSFRIGTAVR